MTHTTAFVFPGQGSQKVGMASAFYHETALRPLFDEADEALGFKLSHLMFEGPSDVLTLTQNAQPALLLAGVAACRWYETTQGWPEHVKFVAGHSLGEWTALVAARAISLADGLRLVHKRGQVMQQAVPVGEGSMLAVLGLTVPQVEQIAAEAGVYVANDNADGQVVLSGLVGGIEKAAELAKAAGAKRALPLPVSAPFHSPLMQPAADAMAEALASIRVNHPRVPVVTNMTAQAESDPEVLKNLLVQQVTGRVRWRESMIYMAEEGITNLVEFGSGKVLCGLASRCDARLSADAVTEPTNNEVKNGTA